MITLKQGMKLSAIIDKTGIKITDPKASAEAVGADLMVQIVSKIHKAEKEVYALVAEMKNITEAEAEKVDLIDFIKEIAEDESIINFFKSAVK